MPITEYIKIAKHITTIDDFTRNNYVDEKKQHTIVSSKLRRKNYAFIFIRRITASK